MLLTVFCEEKMPQGPDRSEILLIKLLPKENRINFSQENNWANRYRLPPIMMSEEEYNYLSQWKIPLQIVVHNFFDEAIDGKKWIDIKVNFWSADTNEAWSGLLSYTDTTSTRNFVIPPGDSIYINLGEKLIWNQRDIDGNSIHLTNSYNPIFVTGYSYVTDSVVVGTFPPEYMLKTELDTTYLTPVDTVIAFNGTKKIFAQAEIQIFKNYHTVKSEILEFYIHHFYPTAGFVKKFPYKEAYYYPWESPPFPLIEP